MKPTKLQNTQQRVPVTNVVKHYTIIRIPDYHTRGQTNTDNPAEYGYIRNRIVPLGMKRIAI